MAEARDVRHPAVARSSARGRAQRARTTRLERVPRTSRTPPRPPWISVRACRAWVRSKRSRCEVFSRRRMARSARAISVTTIARQIALTNANSTPYHSAAHRDYLDNFIHFFDDPRAVPSPLSSKLSLPRLSRSRALSRSRVTRHPRKRRHPDVVPAGDAPALPHSARRGF